MLALLLAPPFTAARKFYPDDPLLREPAPMPVVQAQRRRVNEYYDFFQNTFFDPAAREGVPKGSVAPSEGVNTLGEVPDSAWFTNRIGSRPMSMEELVRGPGGDRAPAMDQPWVIVSGKNEGVTPGLVFRDSKGRVYFLKFDPVTNPGMASAADAIGSRIFHALGYNTPENYVVRFQRSQLTVDEKSTVAGAGGRARPMSHADIDDMLRKVPKTRGGEIRALASLEIAGELIGPFRYYGTRRDDPNDVVPHENRRDLRGLSVFAAWVNHTDSKSINSLDSIVEEDGLRYVKHYLIDFGAILGSDSFIAKSPRAGNVYLFAWGPAAAQFFSLGLYTPKWMRTSYPDIPEAGRIGAGNFDPTRWKPNYPNPAFERCNPGDAYWAAKKVMAFSDEAIRAIVGAAGYSDPEAAGWIARTLIERRDRIGGAFFGAVPPLDNFAVRGGKLTFEDLAVKHGFAQPRQYSIAWSTFNNETEVKTPIPGASSFEMPRSAAAYLAAEIRSGDPRKAVTVFIRDGRVVGIDRTW